jgi:TRAP-type C4-dicarboxylate transport system permease small subunit
VGTDKHDDKDALDDAPAVAAEPGPAAPVAAEVATEVAEDDARRAGTATATAAELPEARVVSDGLPAMPPADQPLRDSMPAIGDDAPLTFPDDGGTARALRKVDHVVGNAEQALLFGLLAIVVLSGAFQGLAGKLAGKSYPWTYELVRTGVLAIAMIGAAFASHQQRHLAMDLISRRLPPRGRLMLRIFLGVVTIFVTAVLVRGLWHLFEQVSGEHNANNILPAWVAPLTMPLGGALIIFHTLLHLVIDADYLARGKLPPERARSAH